jgi:hypothetical protein
LKKRSENHHENGHDYYHDLEVFLDKILSQDKLGDKKTEEILAYIIDHIRYLEQVGMISKEEADSLFSKLNYLIFFYTF